MMLTFLLARVFGIYLVVAGIAVISRKKFVMSAIGAFVEDRFAQLSIAIFEIIFGLIIINIHSIWTTLPSTLVSLLGWCMFLKGVAILLMPESMLAKFVKMFNTRNIMLLDGIVALVLGGYLALIGFNLM